MDILKARKWKIQWAMSIACLTSALTLCGMEKLPWDRLSGIINSADNIIYVDGHDLMVSGKFHNERNYARLPQKYASTVRPPVWSLSQNSTGITIRFRTDSPQIWARWELADFRNRANMTDIGASGLDLYCRVGSQWQYVNSGIPRGEKTEATLITHLEPSMKEFILHLPLYESVVKLEIGVVDGSSIEAGSPFHEDEGPILFYGTSITQGASASRPGMAYPSILSRKLDRETINLGFSGNGRFEQAVGEAICEADLGLIVIDCTPNSAPEVIRENALPLIHQLRKCHPHIPILLVESIRREYAHFKLAADTIFGTYAYIDRQNHTLRKVYEEALDAGITDLHYLEGDYLIGDDHEGTVDGTHLTDLGMVRMAEHLEQKLLKIMAK